MLKIEFFLKKCIFWLVEPRKEAMARIESGKEGMAQITFWRQFNKSESRHGPNYLHGTNVIKPEI